jgi:hypothetical protein
MSGDAKECREHALRCEQFAEHVPTLRGDKCTSISQALGGSSVKSWSPRNHLWLL